MLKELFEASFYITFPKKEDTILMLDERTAEGDFSLVNTLLLLNTNSDVRSHFENKQARYVVFSWKETFPEDQEMDSVEKSMKGMILMSDEVYSPDNESKFDFGFKLKEIHYPDVLVCQ